MSTSVSGIPLILFVAAIALPAQAQAPQQAATEGHKVEKHRFNMTQSGKKMSAEDFDAWMKARGVRVAKGTSAAPAEKPAKDKNEADKAAGKGH